MQDYFGSAGGLAKKIFRSWPSSNRAFRSAAEVLDQEKNEDPGLDSGKPAMDVPALVRMLPSGLRLRIEAKWAGVGGRSLSWLRSLRNYETVQCVRLLDQGRIDGK
jgi:hypothetical protein